MKTYLPPSKVREMTSLAELRGLGIEWDDYENETRFWLAEWPDRSGWYTEEIDPALPELRYCATVGNDGIASADAGEVQRYLWANVEVTS